MAVRHIEDLSRLLDDCSREGILRIERASESTFNKARAIFMKHLDRRVSYVDCVSCLVATDKAADCIFAFDEHFRMLGTDTSPN